MTILAAFSRFVTNYFIYFFREQLLTTSMSLALLLSISYYVVHCAYL